MIRLCGELSLLLALFFALLQGVAPLCGYYRGNPYLLACARPSAWGQCIFVVVAYGLLTIAFTANDFSIAYVAANSHPSLPFMYRLTAVWGAHEGSILLWILILNCWAVIFSIYGRDKQGTLVPSALLPLVLAILGIISVCFLSFLLLTSNPFLPAQIGQTGRDLNPLLQDPGFVIHPPLLYVGYVGFSVAFAITQAALIQGQLDRVWAQITRRFATAAWCFLTLGIMLGSWWAYRVLGWGGFWFWDPVENASLLPWLSGTALIHVLILAEKRNTAKSWTAFLAIISFALSLLGTFLVRSGVLISVHTFANDPARGAFLLLLLAVLITAALVVYVVRIPSLTARATSDSVMPSVWSREMGLLLNSSLLFVAMLTILLGTLYPLILDALHLGNISVGAPYFNSVMTPLLFVVMIGMGLAPLCSWQKSSTNTLWRQAGKNGVLSILGAITLFWFFTAQMNFTAILFLGLCFWILLSVKNALRKHDGMVFAHVGFAIFIMGLILSSSFKQEREVRIKPGDTVQMGPYQFSFIRTTGIIGANYRGIRADFEINKHKRLVTHMYPEKRIYTVRDTVMTNVAIHPGIFRDLYLALGEPLDQDYWSVRLYYKPFIRWIWMGGVIMIIGGILALLQRKNDEGSECFRTYS